MTDRCCDVCGKVRSFESLLFCLGEELWVCSACWYRLDTIDRAPRCPRCYHELIAEKAPARVTDVRA